MGVRPRLRADEEPLEYIPEEATEKILAHPAFHEVMEDVQAKLRDGNVEWRTFDEVFSD